MVGSVTYTGAYAVSYTHLDLTNGVEINEDFKKVYNVNMNGHSAESYTCLLYTSKMSHSDKKGSTGKRSWSRGQRDAKAAPRREAYAGNHNPRQGGGAPSS